jgi:hypothetical protein
MILNPRFLLSLENELFGIESNTDNENNTDVIVSVAVGATH